MSVVIIPNKKKKTERDAKQTPLLRKIPIKKTVEVRKVPGDKK